MNLKRRNLSTPITAIHDPRRLEAVVEVGGAGGTTAKLPSRSETVRGGDGGGDAGDRGGDGGGSAGDTTAKLPSRSETVAVREGKSGAGGRGEVVISVIGIAYEGNPLRHKVTFAVGGPGAPTTTYTKQDVGATVRVKQFEVRLLSADTFDVSFMITPLGKP